MNTKKNRPEQVRVLIIGARAKFNYDKCMLFMYGLDSACGDGKGIQSLQWMDKNSEDNNRMKIENADVVINLFPDASDRELRRDLEYARSLNKEVVEYNRGVLVEYNGSMFDYAATKELYSSTIIAVNRVFMYKNGYSLRRLWAT